MNLEPSSSHQHHDSATLCWHRETGTPLTSGDHVAHWWLCLLSGTAPLPFFRHLMKLMTTAKISIPRCNTKLYTWLVSIKAHNITFDYYLVLHDSWAVSDDNDTNTTSTNAASTNRSHHRPWWRWMWKMNGSSRADKYHNEPANRQTDEQRDRVQWWTGLRHQRQCQQGTCQHHHQHCTNTTPGCGCSI